MKNYLALEKQFNRLNSLEHAFSILGWDEAVMMPAGAGETRAVALAELNVLRHEILISPLNFDLLQAAESEIESLSAWQRANLKEIRQTILRARAVSKDLVEASSLANSRCEQAWRSLRSENNWQDFLPLLENVVGLVREESQQRAQATGLSAYDSLLDLYNPGLGSAAISTVFDQVKTFLPDLIQRVVERQKSLNVIAPDTEVSVEKQKALGLEVMKIIGFDFNKGRLDISHHPFCGGVPGDVRLTTRYNTANFIESLMGVVHETGHACYEQGLPREWIHQPVGKSRGMHIHESQSLLFEIFIGRSRSFLQFLHPIICQTLGLSDKPVWSQQNMYHLFNTVKPDFIRVDADEVTYPAHVILRYEIEKPLIENHIQVRDIPEIWNLKMQEYLGLSTQGNYKNGCMQDMHWSAGAFGYFPSYSLGALTAAQFFSAMKKAMPQLNQNISKGDLHGVREWLSGHIWSQGSLVSTNELIKHATGEDLNPQYFKKHIEDKFLSIE